MKKYLYITLTGLIIGCSNYNTKTVDNDLEEVYQQQTNLAKRILLIQKKQEVDKMVEILGQVTTSNQVFDVTIPIRAATSPIIGYAIIRKVRSDQWSYVTNTTPESSSISISNNLPMKLEKGTNAKN